jgi:hypothetical protein
MVLFLFFLKLTSFEIFIKATLFVGIISSLFLFIQAIYQVFNITPPSGRIPFLDLLDYASFISSTFGFRFNSFFQEPSYFAIYVLPLFAYSLGNKRYFLSFIFFFSLILSSSSLAILGSFLIIGYYIILNKNYRLKIISLLIVFSILNYVFMINSLIYEAFILRSLDKFNSIFVDSSIRFTGQVELFNLLPNINKLFGVGINQLQNYFGLFDINIPNYSNSFVIILFTTGIIGFFFYILFFLILFGLALSKNNRLIYFLILLSVASIDYFVYNPFFFYLLSFIFLRGINEKF